MKRTWLNLAVLAASIFPLALSQTAAAADEAAPSTAKTYVGKLTKAPGNAKIGLCVQGKVFLAYVCGKDDDFLATHSRWFRGEIQDGKISAEQDGAKLTAEVADGKAQGVLTGSDKSEVEFTATAVKDGRAGIYRAEAIIGDDHYVVGWVRDENSETVGAASTGKPKQVKPPVKKKGIMPDPMMVVAPVGSVGTGSEAQNVQGKRVNDITSPLLPGQILTVAALKSVDVKKKLFIVQDPGGKQITLPATNVVFRGPDGKEQPVQPQALSLKLDVRLGRTRVQIEQDDNGKRKVVITRD